MFKQVTEKELSDSQSLRREQLKHRMTMHKLKQFITNTVVAKGKSILQQKKEEERRRR